MFRIADTKNQPLVKLVDQFPVLFDYPLIEVVADSQTRICVSSKTS